MATTLTRKLKKVTDKFFRFPITYQQAGENLGRFGKSEKDINYTEFEVLGIEVFSTSATDAQITIEQIGKYDYAEASIYFHVEDLQAVGLIDSNGVVLMNPNKDYLLFKGKRYELLSATEVGPDKDTGRSVLIQCMVRKTLN
jgi:hypothetical protein